MNNVTTQTYLYNKRCPCTRCRMQGMMVPALLVTLGVTLLLEHLHVARGSMIVSMLLIVFGAVRLLQYSVSAEGHRQPPAAYVPPVPATEQNTNYQEVNRG